MSGTYTPPAGGTNEALLQETYDKLSQLALDMGPDLDADELAVINACVTNLVALGAHAHPPKEDPDDTTSDPPATAMGVSHTSNDNGLEEEPPPAA